MCTTEVIGCFKLFVSLTILSYTFNGVAQLENIPIGKGVNVDRLYVGLLANTNLVEGKSSEGSNSSFQSGVRASMWLIPEKMRVRAFGALRLNENSAHNYINSYEVLFSPLQKVEISVGVMATPTTELRPNPITWQSQVETNAESRIPGGKPGIKIGYRFDKNLKVTYGLHTHDKHTVQHLKIAYKKISASTFFRDGSLFLALKWQYKNSDFVMTRYKNGTALSVIVLISEQYKLYSDIEYNSAFGKLTFGAWGFRRHFQDNKLLRGFLSIGYNKNLKQFQGGLFIHI